MRRTDVKIGGVYLCRVSGGLTRVVVLSEEDGKFVVRCEDSEKPLPKHRRAAALHLTREAQRHLDEGASAPSKETRVVLHPKSRDYADSVIAKVLAETACRVETRAVLAAAYANQALPSCLTHAVDVDPVSLAEIRVFCGGVKLDHIADPEAYDTEAAPTCKVCLRRDPRVKKLRTY